MKLTKLQKGGIVVTTDDPWKMEQLLRSGYSKVETPVLPEPETLLEPAVEEVASEEEEVAAPKPTSRKRGGK
jgi:hypothetical protein